MVLGAVLRATAAASMLLAGEAAAVEVRGAGATFPANLYAAWIDAFAAVDPAVEVRYDPVGSGEGIRRFLAGDVDFGATDRPMSDAEIASAPAGVLHVPATAGMVAIAYNLPGIPGGLKLSRTALAGVFAGEIRYWDDPLIASLNPDQALPHQSVAVVGRRDSSGTTFALTNHLDAISDIWRVSGREAAMLVDWPGPAMTVPGNEGVAGRIMLTDYSIGYVEFSFAQALEMTVAAVENQAGAFIAPSLAAGSAALEAVAPDMPEDGRQLVADPAGPDVYPIVSYSWLLVPERGVDPERTEGLRRFIAWGLDEGQALAGPLGMVPLPGPAAERARAILDRQR